jgi:hypothetical protein
MLAYLDSATGFIQTHFYYRNQFHWDTKLNENIIQGLPPHYFIVFSFFLKYLTNAEYHEYEQYLIFCVEIHIDDPQLFLLHMDLALTAGYWIKFCTQLTKVICLRKYCNLFYRRTYQ